MKSYLQNPNMRFAIALGASIGIGQGLFRGLTVNLGPITGLLVFLPAIAAIALGISLGLEHAARRAVPATPVESPDSRE
jgi:hypothetical protein